MRLLLLFLLINISVFTLAADSTKVAHAIRISRELKIDGVLDEPEWLQSIAVDKFRQTRPEEGVDPTQQTSVKILYTNNALYIGAIMYDTSPDSILRQLGRRDEENLNADDFYFKIDPWNNNQDAYAFGVNAAGVQFDHRFSDYTYDAVWNSAVKITAEGWIAEMEIPYAAIRFPQKNVQDWGLQFTRVIRRIREFDQWSLVPSTASNAQLYWGVLKGVEQIQSPIRLSLTPYLSATYQRTPFTNDDNNGTGYENSYSYNAGADIKYGIDDRFTLDMTLLPDFGQVQSDKKIKNLSYQETIYDENRPFFKEGIELFSKGDLFYSRRIGKIPSAYNDIYDNLLPGEEVVDNPSQVKLLNAFKLSGRTDDGLGIGLFNAVANNTYATVKDSTGSERRVLTEPLTDFNILVFDKQFKNNSSLYIINTHTNRDKGYDDANVTGAGFAISNKKNTFVVSGATAMSQYFQKTGDKNQFTNTIGYKYALAVDKQGGNLKYGLGREEVNTEFKTNDLGYYINPGYVNYYGYVNYNRYKKWKFLRESYNHFEVEVTNNYSTGDKRYCEFQFNSFNNLLSYQAFFIGGGFSPFATYDYQESRDDGRPYSALTYYFIYGGISSDYRKKLAIDIELNRASFFKVYKEDFYEGRISLRLRLSDHLFIKTDSRYEYDPVSIGFAYLDNNTNKAIFGSRRLDVYENDMSVNYIFKNDMLLTVTGRHYWNTANYTHYFNLGNDAHLYEAGFIDDDNDFSSNFFNIDLVYEWRFAPGSYINIVYKNAIETEGEYINRRFDKNFDRLLSSPTINTFSIKFLYYLDYLKLKKIG